MSQAHSSLPFLPFAKPDTGPEELQAVSQAIASGWVTTGPVTKQFEANFNEFLGGGLECLAVNSATAGLHLALEALGIGPGDEVIAPSLTFTATVEVVRYLGAEPVLVDVDPVTLNMCPSRYAKPLRVKPKPLCRCTMQALPAIWRLFWQLLKSLI